MIVLLFSRDGRRLISSEGRAVKIWDVKTLREVIALPENAQIVRFNADGSKLIAVDHGTEAIHIWTGEPTPVVQP